MQQAVADPSSAPAGWSRLQRLLLLLVALAALLLPAFANRTIMLFPDSLGYFHAGEAALDTAGRLVAHSPPPGAAGKPSLLQKRAENGVTASRSVYFGAPVVLLYRLGGGWAVMLAAAALVLVSLRLAVPRLLGTGPGGTTLAIVGLATLGGLSMFVTVMMPDVLTGLMLLGLALLLPGFADMGRGERAWWLLMVLAGVLAHKANLAVAVVVAGLYLLLALARRVPARPLLMLAGLLLAGAAGHALLFVAVSKFAGRAPVEAPFVLARVIGDGTAERYLAANCPESGFTMCRYRDRLPLTENEFLWVHNPSHGVIEAAPPADVAAIIAEANPLILASVSAYPLHQLAASARNFAGQFWLVGVTQYGVGPLRQPADSPGLAGLLTVYPDTPAGRKSFPFDAISLVMLVSYAAALLAVAALWLASAPPGDAGAQARRDAVRWLIAGIIANAAVNGMISGVFDRYQGRVAWLALLAALTLIALRRRPA